MTIPLPSDEQKTSIGIWENGNNQVCSAAAGSGKTTMLLHACQSSKVPVCIFTYNKQLEIDMSSKLIEMKMEQHHCYTFHGLCSKYYQNTPDDDTMHDVITKVSQGELKLKKPFEFARICIDEAQDMKLVFWELITCLVGDVSGVQWFLVGDEVQMLNDYDPDDPAMLDFMKTPGKYFGSDSWKNTRLSTSFRLHSNVAYVVNSMLRNSQHLVPGNIAPEFRKHPVWLCTQSNWNWSRIIIPWLMNCKEDASIDRIFILVAKKKGNPPLKVLVNKLCQPSKGNPNGFQLYIHGVDSQDAKVQGSKIVITTWHASKGMQCDAAAVLGVDWGSKHNALHVALSRSKGHLLVVQDKQKPNGDLSAAAKSATREVVRIDRATDEIDLNNMSIPIDSDESTTEFVINLDVWSPRGRCTVLHELIVDRQNCPPESQLTTSTGIQEINNGSWADVSKYYERAAKLKFEYDMTGRSKFVDFMTHPLRVTKEGFEQRLKQLQQEHTLIGRAKREDLLPEFAWELLNYSFSKQEKSVKDWMTIAICAECWNGFHHNIRHLLPCGWLQESIVRTYVAVLHKHMHDCQEIDSRLIREEHGVLFTCRCFAYTSKTTFTVICEDEISKSSRLLAVLPTCLHSTARECVILNIKTGERRVVCVKDKVQVLKHILDSYNSP